MANSKTYILAIDGGGIRGIIPAYILSQLERRTKKACYEMFDIIGGTSTGGIISAGLTTPSSTSSSVPFTAAALLEMYETEYGKIFSGQPTGNGYATYYGDDTKGHGIEPFLQNILGATMSLSAAQKAVSALPTNKVQQMFTTGYIVNSTGGPNPIMNPKQGIDYGPYLFNWAAAGADAADDYYVWEAARATSAAPTYFPIANLGGGGAGNKRSSAAEKWVVDGGVMSNNPAMWGLMEALRLNAAVSLSDIVLISIGTGAYLGSNGVGIETNSNPPMSMPTDGNWDAWYWGVANPYDLENTPQAGALLNIIMGSVQQAPNVQLDLLQKAGLTYFRLEPSILFSDSGMDNTTPTNIAYLETTATNYIAGPMMPGPGYKDFHTICGLLS